MSQCIQDIHRELNIDDQWTEPHSPWQNSAELNGVKYLKSHAQILLDRTGAPDNLWFLAQDNVAHIHDLSANFNSTGRYQNRYQGGGHQARHIS
jgi:uncharacterized protein YwqG